VSAQVIFWKTLPCLKTDKRSKQRWLEGEKKEYIKIIKIYSCVLNMEAEVSSEVLVDVSRARGVTSQGKKCKYNKLG
jgi:hypothetical protein